MNYTPNHHLPQWVSSDRVRMEDFNQMSLDIETGLTTASSAAETALAKANAAFSPDNLPYVTGSYVGDGANQIINLDFMPSFLIISGMKTSSDVNDTSTFDRYFAIVGNPGGIVGGQLQFRVQILTYGFGVYKAGHSDAQLPILNEANRKYYYIAFR